MPSDSLHSLRDRIQIITFDCYGTLVDWETGIRSAVRDASGSDDPAIFDTYLEIEPQVQAETYRSYRAVQAETLRRLGRRFGFAIPGDRAEALSDSLPHWPVFADTNDALRRLKSRYRIGVLSNIDRDLFEATSRNLSVDIDLLITAQDMQSYKPSHRHFINLITEMGGQKEKVLHAAQSLFHDCVPATRLGITNVWINRREESNTTDAKPAAQFQTVAALADALGA